MGAVISLAKKDDSKVVQHYLQELEREDNKSNGKYQEYINIVVRGRVQGLYAI